jgi:hypothetical protein
MTMGGHRGDAAMLEPAPDARPAPAGVNRLRARRRERRVERARRRHDEQLIGDASLV